MSPYNSFQEQPKKPLWRCAGIVAMSVLGFGLISPLLLVLIVSWLHDLTVKKDVTALNRAQEAYFLEHQQFADSVEKLNINLQDQYMIYSVYSTQQDGNAVFNYAISLENLVTSHIGAVFATSEREVTPNAVEREFQTLVILCASNRSGRGGPLERPTYHNGQLACAQGTTEIK